MFIKLPCGLEINPQHIVSVSTERTNLRQGSRPTRRGALQVFAHYRRSKGYIHPRANDATAFQQELDAKYQERKAQWDQGYRTHYAIELVTGRTVSSTQHPQELIDENTSVL